MTTPMLSTPRRRGRGLATSTVIVLTIIAVGIAGAALLWPRPGANGEGAAADTWVVKRGAFDVTILALGELAAERQINVASQLDRRTTITEIVAEGTSVGRGDVLMRLNSKEIDDLLEEAENEVEAASNAVISAQADLDIERAANASELAKADLDIWLAEQAFSAWRDAESVSMRTKLDLELETARKDYERLERRLEASAKLLEQNFISEDEYRRDEIEKIRAWSTLEQARLAFEVYEQYQEKQDEAKLTSDLEQAKAEKERMIDRHENQIHRLEADLQSAVTLRNREQSRREELRVEQEACTITAPQAGLVVYASSLGEGRYGRNEGQPPQIGTELARNETVIVLPDTSQMAAELKVNEALSGRIEPGQRTIVYSEAMPDTPLDGEVLEVSVLAETGGWRDPNRRDYKVRVRINDARGLPLKPAMRCRGSIYVGRVEGALHVPVTAVFHRGATAYVHVPDGSGFAERAVELGRKSEMFIEITTGLVEGDVVLLRKPDADRITTSIEGEEKESNGNGASDGGANGAEGSRGERGAGGGERRRGGNREGDRGREGASGSGGEAPQSKGDAPAQPAEPSVAPAEPAEAPAAPAQ